MQSSCAKMLWNLSNLCVQESVAYLCVNKILFELLVLRQDKPFSTILDRGGFGFLDLYFVDDQLSIWA